MNEPTQALRALSKDVAGNLPRILIGAVLLACLGASVGAWRLAAVQAQAERHRAFGDLATNTANDLEGSMQAYLEMLHGARGLFQAESDVDRGAWAKYVAALEVVERHPGTAQIGFIRRVLAADRTRFEAGMVEWSPSGIFPAGDRLEYLVMEMVEPADAQVAIGFDAATDPRQFDALSRARRLGSAAATARLVLPTDSSEEPAILVVLPVYRWGIRPTAEPGFGAERREDALEGFVYAALHVRALIAGVKGDSRDLAVSIHDVGFAPGAPFTDSDAVYTEPDFAYVIDDLVADRRIDVGGREWVVQLGALREPVYDASRPFVVLGLGLCVSALMVGLVWSVASSRDRAYALAAAMTSDLREREGQLAIARDQALAASRAKGEFLASMSHEIRTPLNAILGTAELLARTVLSQEQRRYVDVCRKAGDHLLALLNNVLDLSKVEAGQLMIETIDFDIEEVVERCADMLVPRARAKGLELAYHIAPDVPRTLVGDPHRIGQVLVNLLGNSIKFTAKGAITVQVSRASFDGGVKFEVTDTGIGIPADKLGAVFEEFTQVDTSTTRKYGGTGLGLAITKSLCELMGGTINVDSTFGKGSTFWFALPLPAATSPSAHRRASLSMLEGLNVLAADDNGTNRLILGDTLREYGMVPTVVSSGQELLDVLSEAISNDHLPDVVIVDGKMPEMDGYAVVSRIRAMGQLALPVLLLSSDLSAADSDRARRLNLSGQIEKPVRPRDLVDTIARLVDPEAAKKNHPERKSDTPTIERIIRVLIAEDNDDNRMIFEAYLKGEPVEVDFAEDGLVAVLKSSQGDYDLILMDMQMPRMDGFEATRRIRESEKSSGGPRIPIVALTAHALADERQKMLDAGCDDIANKPIRREVMLRVITDRALVNNRVARKASTPAPAPPRQAAPATSPEVPDGLRGRAVIPLAPPKTKSLEPDATASRVRSLSPDGAVRRHRVSPPPMLAAIVPGYLAKRTDDVAKLRTAGNAGDFEAIRTIGHQLKGSGGSFGFPEITRIGAEIEKAGNAQDSTVALEWASALQAYVDNVEIVPPKPATPAPAPMRVPTSPGDTPGTGRIRVTPSPMLAAIVPGYLQKRSEDVGLLRSHLRHGDFESVRVIGSGLRGSGGSFGFLEITRLGDVIEHAAQQHDETTLNVAVTELESYLGRLEIVK